MSENKSYLQYATGALAAVGRFAAKRVGQFFEVKDWEKAHASGMARQGLGELRAAFYPDSNIAQPTDPGIYGMVTQGEAADQRHGEAKTVEPYQVAPPEVAVVPEANRKTTAPAPTPPEQEVVTSWGSGKLEQCNRDLSARQSIEPDHDKDLER